ncbi:MAG: GNAT family N-acetyltransferase [Pseudomonadota bacterium]
MSVSAPQRAVLRDIDRFQLRLGEPDDLTVLGEIDADAGALFEQAGLFLDLPDDHEFPAAERRRWRECLAARTTLVMVDRESGPIGFAALGRRDGEHYLAQLSVRLRFMRLGLGGALLEAAGELLKARGARALWLTTYNHLPWNRPFYEQHGFTVMAESDCGPELLQEHAIERRWLPMPQERVLMRRKLGAFAA